MVDISASIGIKAMMDTSDVDRGKGKIIGLFDEITRKGKETNLFFMRATGLLKGLLKLGVGFGAGIVAGITGLVAASPQFKAFLLSLKAPWMRLTRFFGETFKPILDLISKKFREFVEVVTGSEAVRDFFDKWVTKIGEFLETISQEDMKNFLDWIVKAADKTVTTTLDILLGKEGEPGILDILMGILTPVGNVIKKTLEFSVKMVGMDNTVKGAMVGAALLSGHPAVALGLFSLFALQAFTPEKAAAHVEGVTEAATDFMSALEAAGGGRGVGFSRYLEREDIPLHVRAAHGLIYQGISQAQQAMNAITIIIEDKTGGGVSAQTVTPHAALEVT